MPFIADEAEFDAHHSAHTESIIFTRNNDDYKHTLIFTISHDYSNVSFKFDKTRNQVNNDKTSHLAHTHTHTLLLGGYGKTVKAYF